MDRFWKAMFVAPLLAACAGAGHAGGTTDVPLRHTSAEAAYAAVKDTPGRDSVTVHLKDYSISFRGTEEAVSEAKSRLALVDVPSREIAVKLQFVRYERDANGKERESLLLSPLISTLNHVPAAIESMNANGLQAPALTLTPVLNRDGTVTLDVAVRQSGHDGRTRPALRVERRLRPDAKVRLLGLTESEDKLLRRAVEAGEVVTERGPYTATYLDVTVLGTPPASRN